MAAETLNSPSAPQGVSRYTEAMANCLAQLDPGAQADPDPALAHTLVNLIQGRMLEYLADTICRKYGISDAGLRQRIVGVLLGILSDEFFALFRTTIDKKPGLVVRIAKRIIRKEHEPKARSHIAQGASSTWAIEVEDRLYPAIFKKYFEYKQLDTLLEIMESDAEIQKILLQHLLATQLPAGAATQRLQNLLEQDEDGVAANLFMSYLKSHDLNWLLAKVKNDAWREDLEAMRARLVHLRGE